MFSTLNEKYQKTISDTEDEKLIMEAITGSDMDPSIEAAAEDEVDVYSVPRKDLDKLDKFADKLVSSSDYDDEDLDDLLDDGYEDAIVVAEASVTTPSGDKPGDYNSGIKSGEVNYKMTDCEDRGGVGVNSVIARNDQLSESIVTIAEASDEVWLLTDRMLTESVMDILVEASEENKKGKFAAVCEKVREGFARLIEAVQTFIARIVSRFAAGKYGQLQFNFEEVSVKPAVAKISELKKVIGEIGSVDGTDPDSVNDMSERLDSALEGVDAIVEKYTNAPKNKIGENDRPSVMRRTEIIGAMKQMKTALSNAKQAINSTGTNEGTVASLYSKTLSAIAKITNSVIRYNEAILRDAVWGDGKSIRVGKGQDKTYLQNRAERDFGERDNMGNALTDKLKKKDAKRERDLAIERATKSADKRYADKMSELDNSGKNEKAAKDRAATVNFNKANRKQAAEHAKQLKKIEAEAKKASKKSKSKNESAFGFGIFDESTYIPGTYGFDEYLVENIYGDGYEYLVLVDESNASTYEEFKEHLKTDGTLKVEPPKVDAHPKDDMAKRDPAQPGLTNETSLAKNTLCKAYTADQLASIPSSKMSAVRTAITDTIATKNAAIASLKESYEAHLGDSYEIRSAILEDASMIRRDLDNLQHNLALVEDMLNPESLDSLAESVFGESSSDWSYLFEDSEADLDDLDLGDDEKDSDSDKDEKDDDKDDKKSKKSEKSKKDDNEECEDDECDDEDKDDDDDKKSKKSDKSKSDKEDKDDDKKEGKDDEEVDESASLLAVIGDLMSALD